MAKPFPTQKQLVLPLLDVLDEAGGRCAARDASNALAGRVGLDTKQRSRRTYAGQAAGEINAWDRWVRWVRQEAVEQGLVTSAERGVWALTDQGRDRLQNIRPGFVVRVFETSLGVALWAEIESALGVLDDGMANLILTSPPYPLMRKKEYGNLDAHSYADWMVDLGSAFFEKLADDGSFVLNLGDVWNRGSPTMSLYQERLLLRLVDDVGFHLAERFWWENPSKMPSPAQWVTVERIRVTPSVEPIYHLSKSTRPKADNRRVLREYSPAMQSVLARGGQDRQARPSGHVLSPGAFGVDNGGSIPHNLLVFPNTRSNDAYARRCREAGIKRHPARFPAELPDFFIRYLTDPGDVVMDPFGGSLQTAAVAEALGRRWVTVERSLEYLRGGHLRFEESVDPATLLAVSA